MSVADRIRRVRQAAGATADSLGQRAENTVTKVVANAAMHFALAFINNMARLIFAVGVLLIGVTWCASQETDRRQNHRLDALERQLETWLDAWEAGDD